MDHRQIIDLWPSVPELARDLEIPSARAYKWHERRRIPPEWWLTMLECGRARNILQLDIEDFAIGARGRAKDQAA